MSKRSYRRFTADEKLMTFTEVAQPGIKLSEPCCKHCVSPALVCRWRAVAQQATTQALQKVDTNCAPASSAGPHAPRRR
jgi:transposase-like protein